MRVVFMGTPDFAVPSLRVLLQKRFNVVAVITQPDRPGGRGKKIISPPVKVEALKSNLRVLQPEKIRNPEFIETLKGIRPDIIVVAAFGQILPAEILYIPPFGCINVHASLLPAYRGSAPIHRVVINGERETGITIMKMDTGLDTGDIILQDKITIDPEDTVGIVHDRLASLGGQLLIKAIEQITSGLTQLVSQDDAFASYADMLTREDEIIQWRCDAQSIKNQVRGLNPWPGARTYLEDKLIKVWRVTVSENFDCNKGEPGQVLKADHNHGILVCTGEGAISINELQLQGKKKMLAQQFLRGNSLIPGTMFSATPVTEGGSR